MAEHRKNPMALDVEQWFYLSLSEVSSSFGIQKEFILEIIDEGIVSIQKDEKNQLKFNNEAIQRIHKVLRLNRDLGLNLAGAGLALELIDEIERLRALLGTR